ncbi:ABC transporter substrate-binding protein [Paenibacillus sp.]|uniref:ABC transporter substrate-binding protein n=1 Tax=Paenibacillus sp. TaxID=58172 RepID=UPI002D22B3AD|nr:ABC transporter substrate-binding protein [Paenibacillus sp.]HZG84311.1 ABC transporter substrate-binding protein [Paenibacillus sp.]
MKKSVGMMLSGALLVGLLSACGGGGSGGTGEEATGGSETITLNAIFMKQAGYSEDAINEATAQFMEQNPNIKVENTFVPYESLETKILTSNGNLDVALIDAPWTAKFVEAGILEEVTDKLPDADRADIFEGALSAVEYGGKLYGMPWLNDTKYLFYNKEMLEQAGIAEVPATWGELLEAAKIIKEQNIVEYPIVWSWKQAEALAVDFASITESFGGHLVTDGQPTLNDPKNIEALEFMVQSLQDGLSNPNSREFLEEDVRGTFSSGKAAFALNWAYMYNLANDPNESSVAGKVGIAIDPGTDGIVSASTNGGMGLAIPAGSGHPDEAWQFIQFLASKDFQKAHAKDAMPIWKSLFEDEAVIATNPDLVNVSKEQYKYLINRPQVPWYGELSTELQVAVSKALLGNVTPEQALNDLQAKAIEMVE